VLGADTRATAGPIVADKNCEKIHYLAPNIFCCGAGTSADCENVTEMMSSNLTLHRLSTGWWGVLCAPSCLAHAIFEYCVTGVRRACFPAHRRIMLQVVSAGSTPR
jgi:20S proteasome subunit beta 2